MSLLQLILKSTFIVARFISDERGSLVDKYNQSDNLKFPGTDQYCLHNRVLDGLLFSTLRYVLYSICKWLSEHNKHFILRTICGTQFLGNSSFSQSTSSFIGVPASLPIFKVKGKIMYRWDSYTLKAQVPIVVLETM